MGNTGLEVQPHSCVLPRHPEAEEKRGLVQS